MATTEFDIDSYIGEWGYSNRYIKSYLNAAGKIRLFVMFAVVAATS